MGITFIDRQAKYPNRYRITKSDGSAEYVTLERADEATKAGTPLNAATFNALSGELDSLAKDFKCLHKAESGQGYEGYIQIAELTIVGVYCDTELKLTLTQRGLASSDVYVRFNSSVSSTDPTVAMFENVGPARAYLNKNATGKWDLYVKKSGTWDCIEVLSLQQGNYNRARLTITWTDVFTDMLPTDAVSATPRHDVWYVNGVYEYAHPEMIVGKEYRTAERYNGNPVYAKLIDLGDVPVSTDGTPVLKRVAHGVAWQNVLSYYTYWTEIGYNQSGNQFMSSGNITVYVHLEYDNFVIRSTDNASVTAKVLLKYFK